MKKHINGLMVCCSLGVSLLLATPAWAATVQAAASATQSGAPTATATATLEQLDEIVLQGKRLEQRLQESEQRFYTRYNELNTRDDLDVRCDFYWTDRSKGGTRAVSKTRSCVPAFYAKALMDNQRAFTGQTFDAGAFGGCHFQSNGPVYESVPIVGGGSSDQAFESVGFYGGYSEVCGGFSSLSFASAPAPAPAPVSAQLVWLSRRDEFVANLRTVLRGDPQLQVMAGQLDALTLEGQESQQRVAEARQLKLAARKCARPISPRIVTVCGD